MAPGGVEPPPADSKIAAASRPAEVSVRIDGSPAITLPVTRAREATGTFRLAAGHLDVDGLRFRTDEGSFQTRLSADLMRLPFSYTLAVEGRPLDINAMAGATGKGGGFGPAHLTLEAGGEGPDPTRLSGKGVLRLEAGTLPSTPRSRAPSAAPACSGAATRPAKRRSASSTGASSSIASGSTGTPWAWRPPAGAAWTALSR